MERMSKALRYVLKHLKDARGVSLYEITAAVAMTGILAAVAVPVIIEKTTEARAARVVQEVDSIYKAISAFQKDTGKFPGQAEAAVRLLISGPKGFFALFPDDAADNVTVVGGVGVGANGACTQGCANLNDYLVRDPNNTSITTGVGSSVPVPAGTYPNWKGPYIDEVFIDQWERAYIANVVALYQLDQPLAVQGLGVVTPKSCGYAWVISGGADRKLATKLSDTSLSPASDDIGKNNGKRVGGGPGC